MKKKVRTFESSVTCLKQVEEVRKRTATGDSEDVANVGKGHFSRAEMTSVDAKTMA